MHAPDLTRKLTNIDSIQITITYTLRHSTGLAYIETSDSLDLSGP